MKKIITLIIIMFISFSLAYSQQGYKFMYITSGISYERSYNTRIGIDFPNKYYNSWDVNMTFNFDPDDHKEYINAYLLGLNYKPCIYKGINSTIRYSLGISVGSNLHKFLLNANTAMEYNYSIAYGVELTIFPELNYYPFNDAKKWRIYGNVGLRIRI